MSSKRRHIGRRVAGVGVAVALMVLGLEAPAFAVPAISAISPNTGPNACVAVVTGTGFAEFPEDQTDVDFMPGAINQTFSVIDDTTIWVSVSGLTPGTSYSVRVTNPGSPSGVTSTATFLATTGVGGCGPTITSFTPCASPGDVVVITGTNLIAADFSGGEVRFSPYDDPDNIATHTVPDVDDVTSLSVIVPSGTGTANPTVDGPIEVITDVGSVFSTTSFLLPPPDCAPVTGNEHARAITFKLKKSGKASGVVSSSEDPAFTDCAAAVPVKIQKKKKGDGWKTKATATTDDTGSYSATINAKPGKYRALAPAMSLGDPVTDNCLKAKSATRTIK
jgi:hypothetical protein